MGANISELNELTMSYSGRALIITPHKMPKVVVVVVVRGRKVGGRGR